MSDDDDIMAAVEALTDELAQVLAGHNRAIQGAALADCLAIWLAGHEVLGDEAATRTLRAEILASHLSAVRRLVPENAKILGTTP